MNNALRLCCLLAGLLLAQCQLPTPTVSEDVLIAQGGYFNFTCSVPDRWAETEGNYVQIYKDRIVYQGLDDNPPYTPGVLLDALSMLISTNVELNEVLDASRYTASYDADANVVITVTDAQAGDSGIWACRTTQNDTTSTLVEHVVSEPMANITVTSPVLGMQFATAPDMMTDDWQNQLTSVAGQVMLNTAISKYFACQVYYNVGVPYLSVYWRNGDELTELDRSYWTFQGTSFTSVVPNDNLSHTLNQSLILWAKTDEIPDLVNQDGSELVCVATVPLQDDTEISIEVTGVYVEIPNPTTSSDVYIPEGGNFTFTCHVSDNWAAEDGHFVQVYRERQEFFGLNGPWIAYPGIENDVLNQLISTNLQLHEDIDELRFQVGYDDNDNIVVTVTDARTSEGGIWACRTLLEDTNSLAVDFSVSSNMTNITVIGPVSYMRFVGAADTESWIYNVEWVGEEVTLSTAETSYFGCEVYHTVGIPSVSAYWRTGDVMEEVDASVWTLNQGPMFTIRSSISAITFNGSVILASTTDQIPDLLGRNGAEFVCVASLTFMDDMNISIPVRTTALPSASVSQDVLTSEGDSFTFTCSVPNSWAVEEGNFVQIYKERIEFQELNGIATLHGEMEGELNWILATNLQLHTALDAERYSVSYDAAGNLMISVTDARAEDGGFWACRTVQEITNSTETDNFPSATAANITVISPIHGIRFVTAEDITNWGLELEEESETVSLNASEPMRFGCQVYYNVGIPSLRGYWKTGEEMEEIDYRYWDYEGGISSVLVGNDDLSATNNASVFLSTTTQEIPNLGNRDGAEFVCTATVSLMEDEQLSISVTAFGPTETPGPDQETSGSSVTLVNTCFILVVSGFMCIASM